MNKISNIGIFTAVLSLFLAACSTDDGIVTNADRKDRFVTCFQGTSSIESRVSFGDFFNDFWEGIWTDGESAEIIMTHNGGMAVIETEVETDDNRLAHFTAVFDAVDNSSDFTYFAVVPADNYISFDPGTGLRYKLASEQAPSAACFDPMASTLVGITDIFDEQQGEPESDASKMNVPLSLTFDYGVAYGKMSLKDLALGTGEQIIEVSITADEAEMAGTADFKGGVISVVEGISELRITASSTDDIWLVSLPAVLEDGKWGVDVYTDKGRYSRRVSDTGKALTFSKGVVTSFGVDMSTAVFSTTETTAWTRVIMAKDCELAGGPGLEIRPDGWLAGMNAWRPSSLSFTLTDVPYTGKYRLLCLVKGWIVGSNHGFALSVNGGDEELHWFECQQAFETKTIEMNVHLRKGTNELTFKTSTDIPDNHDYWSAEFFKFLLTNQDTPTELDETDSDGSDGGTGEDADGYVGEEGDCPQADEEAEYFF